MNDNPPCGCKADHDALLALTVRFDEFRRSNEQRLEKLNELREQVSTDRVAFLRYDVYRIAHETLEKRVDAAEGWQNRAVGVVALAIALSGLFGAFVGHWWH